MRHLVAVLATALVVVGGCSGSDDPAPTATPTSPAPTTPATTPAPVPTTLAGACDRLLGEDGLVEQTLALVDAPLAERQPVQTALFELVTTDLPPIDDPVRRLVDFLDDPQAYLVDGRPDVFVTEAVDTIDAACA